MKKIYTFLALSVIATMMHAQCVVTAIGNNITCNGLCNGSATANAVGVPTISYLWAPGGQTTATVTGLCAGTYTVSIVDGTSCTSTATVTITEPAAITATATKTNITCNGLCNGTATAFATGGSGGFTHKWNTIPAQTTALADSLCVGSYYDTIRDANGCSFILGPVTITEPAPLVATVTCSSVSCFGGSNGSAIATETGGTAAYTYSWSTTPVQTNATATGLTPGTYSCTVTDANGCTSSASCTVNQPLAALAVTMSSNNASCSTCCDGSAMASASAGTPGYTYLWAPGGSTSSTPPALCPGNYTVTVTDANGCTETDSVSVNFTTGIAESGNGLSVRLYPNPTHGDFEVTMNVPTNSIVTFVITDVLGAEISKETISASGDIKKRLSIQTLPPGVYFLQTGVAGKYATNRLIRY